MLLCYSQKLNRTEHFTEAHYFTPRKLIITLEKTDSSLLRLTLRTRVLRTRPSLLHFSRTTLSVTLLRRIGTGSLASFYSPATRLRALGPTWPLGPGPIHISRAWWEINKYSVLVGSARSCLGYILYSLSWSGVLVLFIWRIRILTFEFDFWVCDSSHR